MSKLTEIKQALSKATTGPWVLEHSYNDEPTMIMRTDGKIPIAEFFFENGDNDAALLTKAPDYITYLISLLEEKDKALQSQHRYFERISVTFGEFECQRLAKEAMEKYTSSNNTKEEQS